MRKFVVVALFAVISIAFVCFQGCDWEDTGSSSFNTSQGGGVDINFSGYYRPRSGAFLFGSNTTHFVMTQIGNSLEVFDNNNSYYTGSIGSPGVQARPNAVSYTAGAVMLQAQVSFTGVNQFTGANMTFVGIVRAVAVDDVDGIATELVTTSYSSFDVLNTNTPGVTVGFGDTSNLTTTVTTEYTITEANSQYVLEGNWIEAGTVVGVAAIAPSTTSTFSSAAETTTTTTTATP